MTVTRCPYCNGWSTTGGFTHEVTCPKYANQDGVIQRMANPFTANKVLQDEIIRLRDALSGILLMANCYTEAESVRLALIAQRCREELK